MKLLQPRLAVASLCERRSMIDLKRRQRSPVALGPLLLRQREEGAKRSAERTQLCSFQVCPHAKSVEILGWGGTKAVLAVEITCMWTRTAGLVREDQCERVSKWGWLRKSGDIFARALPLSRDLRVGLL